MAVEFLTDRDIGRHLLPTALREHGQTTRTLFDVYGVREQFISDAEWLQRAGEEGWAVITADLRMRWRPTERGAIDAGGVKVFTMPHGNLTGPEQVARVTDNLPAILRACERPGAAIYTMMADRITRRYP